MPFRNHDKALIKIQQGTRGGSSTSSGIDELFSFAMFTHLNCDSKTFVAADTEAEALYFCSGRWCRQPKCKRRSCPRSCQDILPFCSKTTKGEGPSRPLSPIPTSMMRHRTKSTRYSLHVAQIVLQIPSIIHRPFVTSRILINLPFCGRCEPRHTGEGSNRGRS